MRPVCPAWVPCKCCGARAGLYGYLDFHKSCADAEQPAFSPSGIPIPYHRCGECGFLFSTAFDGFTHADFLRHVYNHEYHLADPRFAEERPAANAEGLAKAFAGHTEISVLDYGGGSGKLAARLRAEGFADVDTYDPFVAAFSRKPARRYDLVLCLEVVEHTTDPRGTFGDLASLVAEGGMMLMTTLVQPRPLEPAGLGWWYAAPRNGHVSLHTRESLHHLAASGGFKLHSAENLHLVFRDRLPAFAARLPQPD